MLKHIDKYCDIVVTQVNKVDINITNKIRVDIFSFLQS